MLDIDFGTYPFVTSSSPSAGGICTSLATAPRCIGDLIGVVKAYTTRVGSGPFPTELLGEEGDLLRNAVTEFGTTTGCPIRCGWLDIVALKYCCEINGFSSLNLTKLDVLSGLPEIKLGVSNNQIDGKKLQSFPGDLDTLEQVHGKHEVLPGWQSDISSVRSYNELPPSCPPLCGEDRRACWCSSPLHWCWTWEGCSHIQVKLTSFGPQLNQTIQC